MPKLVKDDTICISVIPLRIDEYIQGNRWTHINSNTKTIGAYKLLFTALLQTSRYRYDLLHYIANGIRHWVDRKYQFCLILGLI